MRRQAIISLLIGGCAIWAELRPIRKSTLFFDWVDSVPFVFFCICTLLFLVLNTKHYFRHKQIVSFVPLLICVSAFFIIAWHKKRIESLEMSETLFTATTYQIGNDGGFIIDFKRDGRLKAERRDHWSVTYYWGNYSSKNDTINLDIPLDFKLGKKGVMTDTSLRLLDDTINFQMERRHFFE